MGFLRGSEVARPRKSIAIGIGVGIEFDSDTDADEVLRGRNDENVSLVRP
jgi:hypothetical protein